MAAAAARQGVEAALMLAVAVVFQLALDGADPALEWGARDGGATGARPTWGGLCRQLPRLLVQALNGEGDRGIRFFPFIGSQGESRGFLHVPQPFDLEVLDRLHRQENAWLLVDGVLTPTSWRLRVLDRNEGRVVFDEELPFDPGDPRPALERAVFELTGLLRWPGAPPALPAPPPPALAPFLAARDHVLALEANMVAGSAEYVVRGAAAALEMDAEDAAVVATVLELAALLVPIPGAEPAVLDLLSRWVAAARPTDAQLERAGRIAEVGGRADLALAWYRAAAARPHARMRAIALAVAADDLDLAEALAVEGVERGIDDPQLVAHLATVALRRGQRTAWLDHCETLAARARAGDVLPPAAARVAADALVREERTADAVAMLRATLAAPLATPGDRRQLPALWLELARAELLEGETRRAIDHLERCMSSSPSPEIEAEVRRLRRFAHRPELVTALLAIENAMAAGDWDGALASARALVRRHKSDAEAWLVLGIVEHRRGRERRAERALRRALRHDPGLAEAQNRLGVLLLVRGRAEEGYELLSEAVRRLPTDPACRLHLAQACALVGRRDEGRAHIAEAQRLGALSETVERIEAEFFGD